MKKNLLIFLLCISQLLFAQKSKNQNTVIALPFDTTITNQLQFRNVGPWRGGRSTAVVGDLENKQLFYFGATGGGVWKSNDGGNNWNNISDGFFGGSVGAITVSKSDPSVIYVGMGENSMRGNVSEGFGMWKSENGGRSWKNIGLNDTRHIMRIVVHPKNSDIVYCAALGHLFGPNNERGIFRSTDGGNNWKKIMYVSDNAGACDLVIDPTDPNILVATFWNVKRTPYSLESGGPGSGIYKTTDGGDNWINISTNKGLPKDTLGIIGITISKSNPNIYYAIVESKTGGVFKSTDAGKTWTKTNSESNLRQRAWYFSKIFCDPSNENIVYVLNVEFWKSTDGGKTFSSINTPHGDHHDLWIDPNDAQRMIIADDGGAQVSFDGGKNWSTYYNQPTSQIYRVTTDNDVPYRLLGAQQDNSSLRIKHRSEGGQIDGNDWEPTAGFESGHIVADPDNYNVVYGGNYSGFIGVYNHLNGDSRNITVWPNDPLGQGADIQKYRFQWNFPLFFSPHDANKLYAAGNVLFSTTDNGTTWNAISPDLTTNDKSKQQPSGGIITKDNTGVEVYCTIFAAAESPLEKDVIYTGSDDGLIHITKNGGQTWENITPVDLPKFTMINCVEPDPLQKGKMYFAGTKYKSDDFTPYLYVTEDYGKSWKKITNGINKDHFTRVIRADKKRKGLLYCGTEYGMYISYNDGANWYPFQINLPIVPITDMTIKNNDLILATQGRGFWILDDISALQEMNNEIKQKPFHVYTIRDSYRIGGYQIENPVNAGKNPTPGLVINYYIPAKPGSPNEPDSGKVLSIELYDNNNKLINTYSSSATDKNVKLEFQTGLNQFNWNFNYADAKKVEGMFLWNGTPGGPSAAPGAYKAEIKYGSDSVLMNFNILPDPNSDATPEDYQLQHDFLIQVRDKFDEVQTAINDMWSLQKQMDNYINKLGDSAPKELKDSVAALNSRMTSIIESVYETRNKSNQDMLNYGIKLNDKLAGVYNAASSGNFRPSKNQISVYNELSKEADIQLAKFEEIKKTEVKKINDMIRSLNLPIIIVEEDK
ncbi:MAG: glycosyl hydrolase [Bacteroidetes bacterium]|nr:glycosyl hydrolase [Bacteroidota bacterium]